MFKILCQFWVTALIYVNEFANCESVDTEIPILSTRTKLTNWDRERIIFDHEYHQQGKQLKQILLGPDSGYDKDMMPLMSEFHVNPQVTVGLHFRLIQLVALDTNTEDLEVVYVTQYYWFDPQLVWYKPDFSRDPYDPLPKSWLNLTDPVTNQKKSPGDISLQDILVSFHDVKKKYTELEDKDNELGHIDECSDLKRSIFCRTILQS